MRPQRRCPLAAAGDARPAVEQRDANPLGRITINQPEPAEETGHLLERGHDVFPDRRDGTVHVVGVSLEGQHARVRCAIVDLLAGGEAHLVVVHAGDAGALNLCDAAAAQLGRGVLTGLQVLLGVKEREGHRFAGLAVDQPVPAPEPAKLFRLRNHVRFDHLPGLFRLLRRALDHGLTCVHPATST